ncbi:Uncharacterized protein HZ326_18934 [Fusarium oxysporum f. sp. albedinis]|nr:Uncharacterized protein HZ326_18934 [Fusarium oxysporum f. sp. albedinis]
MHFVGIYFHAYKEVPTSTQIRFEACRIILASEASSYPNSSSSSWLRDLIMSEYDTAHQAAREPIRSTIENKHPILLPKVPQHQIDRASSFTPYNVAVHSPFLKVLLGGRVT